jgi:hypothetical protein
MKAPTIIHGSAKLEFADFVEECDRRARLKLEPVIVTFLELSVYNMWAVWRCAGRQVQVFETESNTVNVRLYATLRRSGARSTTELKMTSTGVAELVSLMAWLGASVADAA